MSVHLSGNLVLAYFIFRFYHLWRNVLLWCKIFQNNSYLSPIPLLNSLLNPLQQPFVFNVALSRQPKTCVLLCLHQPCRTLIFPTNLLKIIYLPVCSDCPPPKTSDSKESLKPDWVWSQWCKSFRALESDKPLLKCKLHHLLVGGHEQSPWPLCASVS